MLATVGYGPTVEKHSDTVGSRYPEFRITGPQIQCFVNLTNYIWKMGVSLSGKSSTFRYLSGYRDPFHHTTISSTKMNQHMQGLNIRTNHGQSGYSPDFKTSESLVNRNLTLRIMRRVSLSLKNDITQIVHLFTHTPHPFKPFSNEALYCCHKIIDPLLHITVTSFMNYPYENVIFYFTISFYRK